MNEKRIETKKKKKREKSCETKDLSIYLSYLPVHDGCLGVLYRLVCLSSFEVWSFCLLFPLEDIFLLLFSIKLSGDKRHRTNNHSSVHTPRYGLRSMQTNRRTGESCRPLRSESHLSLYLLVSLLFFSLLFFSSYRTSLYKKREDRQEKYVYAFKVAREEELEEEEEEKEREDFLPIRLSLFCLALLFFF